MPSATVAKRSKLPNQPGKPLSRWLIPALSSTVGSKFLVALTGLGLTGFVYAHMAGNLLVFSGPKALIDYGQFLKDRGALLWAARLGLLAIFVLHLWLALRLKLRNMAARPTRYVKDDTVQATWASRHMALTGLVILAFVIYHLAHFTFGLTQNGVDATGQPSNFLAMRDTAGQHDVYAMVINGFRNPWVVAIYVVAQVLLAVHLSHGIASVFQSLGLNHPRYWPTIRRLGIGLAAILLIGNVTMPLAVYLRLIGANYIP